MIKTNINSQIADALKSHDEKRLTTLRMLSSSLNYEFIAKQHELSEDEEITVVRREIKKRNDEIESYKSVLHNNPEHIQEKIDGVMSEIEILKTYLPPEMDESKLIKIIEESISLAGATSIKDMGKVIGMVKSKTGNSADGSKIAELIKARLQ